MKISSQSHQNSHEIIIKIPFKSHEIPIECLERAMANPTPTVRLIILPWPRRLALRRGRDLGEAALSEAQGGGPPGAAERHLGDLYNINNIYLDVITMDIYGWI